MRLLKAIKNLRSFVERERKKGKKIGFVPTMGYLHQGHLSLARRAKKENDIVILSIYVNPTQFGPREDFKRYPRNLRRDMKFADSVGVNAIFYPTDKEMYPEGFSTFVNVERLSKGLCGKSRPAHFRGVATVVTKLFNIVKPDIAYFGQKDAQQAIIIKRMAKDLDMDLKIKVLPAVREPDGLAMSSRNRYLNRYERSDAICLFLSLQKAKSLIKSGKRNPREIVLRMRELIELRKSARIDYIEIVDTKNLKPAERIAGEILIALAVWIGKTRLIDNCVIKV